ncbi:exonuclease domain-containing protein [Thiomicrorhabdus indica]|uniref:exonuclease domain-containing protein n=1 Tax=Thiomicrorhabdus indica TaxID=2267253 RepID=UPI00102DE295|nr:exonuclease domain-containing protein [Thiomicrorhabdus indica]
MTISIEDSKHLMNATIHGFPESMVLLDVETTGGKATRDRIIEIGLLVVEKGVVVKTWQTFVNPQTPVPPWIQKLTAIRTEMLQDAPSFDEIAPMIQGVCEGRVLVAHNARFDYGFLKNEFKRLNQSFQVKTLCSVKLLRRFYAQYARHGLDQVIQRLGVTVENRHRALDDAKVIWQLFVQISKNFEADDIAAVCQGFLQKPAVPANLEAIQISRLPNRPGIYRFWQEDKLLYVGKSVRIRDRVMSHFTQDHAVAKDLQMSSKITDIDFEETPSDFGAQLLENYLVKTQRPMHNQRLKKLTKLYQVRLNLDEQGYLRCELNVAQQQLFDEDRASMQSACSESANESNQAVFGLFRSRRQAQQWMEKACSRFQLCPRLTGLENKKSGPCFAMQLKKCLGACCQKEPTASYNFRVEQAFDKLKQQVWPWPEPVVVVEQATPIRVMSKEARRDIRVSQVSCEENQNWYHFHVLDQWRYLQRFTDEQALQDWLVDFQGTQLEEWHSPIRSVNHLDKSEPLGASLGASANLANGECFDLDAYLILIRFLMKSPLPEALKVIPVSDFLAKAIHN